MGLLYGTRCALLAVKEPTLSDISGLYFEMDATKPASFYSDSTFNTLAVPVGPVGGVVDVSGAKLGITGTQTTTAAKPTYTLNAIDGRPALYLDGGDWLEVDALAPYVNGSDKPFSVAAVMQYSSVAAPHCFFSFGRSAISGSRHMCRITPTNWSFQSTDDLGVGADSVGGTPTTNPTVVVFLFSGTTISILINGVTILNEVAHTVGICTLDIASIGIFKTFEQIGFYMLGYIGQLAIWPTRRILDGEASWVTKTLGQKWGVQVS